MWATLRFLVLRWVLRMLRLGPSADDNDVEIAVLRHQLAMTACGVQVRNSGLTSHDVRRPRQLDEALCRLYSPTRVTCRSTVRPHLIVYATQRPPSATRRVAES